MNKEDEKWVISKLMELLDTSERTLRLSPEEKEFFVREMLERDNALERLKGEKRVLAVHLERVLAEIEGQMQRSPGTTFRESIGKYFEWGELENRLAELEEEISIIKPADKETLRRVSAKFNDFIEETGDKNPKFVEKFGERISEIYGDLMALGSGGKRGSTRKIMEIGGKKRDKK